MEDHQRARLPSSTLEAARSLRQTSTDAERTLWNQLRGGQLPGFKFGRQHPLPPYVVDFCSIAVKLIIELDGSQHTDESDRERTRYLQSQGFHVMRFWNNDVLLQTEAVVEAIWNACVARAAPHPNPSPDGRGAQETAEPLT